MPDWTQYVRRRLSLTRLDPHREAEIVEDVARQLDDVYRAARARGESEEEALVSVRQQVPDWTAFAAELERSSRRHERSGLDEWNDASIVHDGRQAPFGGLHRDLVQALRLLVNNPSFTAIAALTIALGVGANTTVFSLVNGVLQFPIPVEDIDEVVLIREQNVEQGIRRGLTSLPTFLDVRNESGSFDAVVAGRRAAYNFDAGGEARRLDAYAVTDGLFEVLLIQPALGRGLTAEDHLPGAQPVAVLTDHFWRSAFGADPESVGKMVRLDGEPFTIVGVAPPEFWFPDRSTALWIPVPHSADEDMRAERSFTILARLRADVGLEEARAELRVIGERIADARPDTHNGWSLDGVLVREDLVSQLSVVLTILYAAVSFVLLITCANVANLLLARATDRGREIAVRSALGAGRGRLVRQLLTESVVLAFVGGGLGVVVAMGGIDAIRSQIADTSLAILIDGIQLDRYVLAHALGLSVIAGLVFGIVPALHASRANLHAFLKDGARSAGGRRSHWMRNALVVAQVALALALLAPTGLLVRLLAEDRQQDLRFDVESVMTLRTSFSEKRYPEWSSVVDVYERSIVRLEELPNVAAAGATSRLPALSPIEPNAAVEIQGRPDEVSTPEVADVVVSPGYLEALGAELLSGRHLSTLDRADSARVAVVSQSMVERFWPDQSAVGRLFRLAGEDEGWIEVVGTVRDVGARVTNGRYVPHVYVPFAQRPSRDVTVLVRTHGDPMAALPAIRAALADVDRGQPFYEARSMRWLVDRARATDSFLIGLLANLAAVALVLALVGIYGVITHAVRQKSREIGVQMALGARARSVLFGVMRQGLTLASVGIVIGMLLAVAIVKSLEAEVADLGGISAAGPSSLVAVGLFMIVTAMLACYLPARRATTVDPVVVLRDE